MDQRIEKDNLILIQKLSEEWFLKEQVSKARVSKKYCEVLTIYFPC